MAATKYKILPEQVGKGSVTHYVRPGDNIMVPVDLDTATQDELKILFDYSHPFVVVDSKAVQSPS